MNTTNRNHEFRKRLIDFSVKVIKLTKMLPNSQENTAISSQIIRSSTSIGANYAESMFALSKPDFIHCLNICKKETAETLHWLEILMTLNPKFEKEIEPITKASESYLKIFISSVKTAQSRLK